MRILTRVKDFSYISLLALSTDIGLFPCKVLVKRGLK